MNRAEFYDIMVNTLKYEKRTYAYAYECLDKANSYILNYGYNKVKAVKTSLMSEGLYSPQDL